MGVKLIDKLMYVGLTAMVLISFYLTSMIWLTPASKSSEMIDDVDKSETTQVDTYKSATDVFLPLFLTRFEGDQLAQTNSESLIKEMQSLINKNKYEQFQLKKFDSKGQLNEAIKTQKGLDMNFVDAFPLTSYLDVLQKKLSFEREVEEDSFSFTHIQVDLTKNQLRFIDTKKNQVLEAAITSKEDPFKKVYEDTSANWHTTTAKGEELLPTIVLSGDEPLELAVYSYISSTRPYTVFRDAFFTDPKELRSNDDTDDLKLYDGSESLVIQQDQQQMNFQGMIDVEQNFDGYQRSYEYIRGLGTNYGSLRLFNVQGATFNYRIFVEGFPVFGEESEGVITVSFSENGQDCQKNVGIRANLNTIQVPIPSDQKVELPGVATILQNLTDVGAQTEKIATVLVGYTWENLEDTGVVDLLPSWYINYDEKWYAYKDLLSELQEKDGE